MKLRLKSGASQKRRKGVEVVEVVEVVEAMDILTYIINHKST